MKNLVAGENTINLQPDDPTPVMERIVDNETQKDISQAPLGPEEMFEAFCVAFLAAELPTVDNSDFLNSLHPNQHSNITDLSIAEKALRYYNIVV